MNIENFYRSIYRIRRAEEEVARLYPSDKIKSPVHLSIGQEAISVGVCEALATQDVVFGTYRSHALYLAKTGDLKGFFAELFGKSTGCCQGKGGSMHLANLEMGMMGTSAVVATTIPQAVGYAYAMKMRGEKKIVAVFLGDGSTEEGVFHESLNFAALKALPIIFVCENNGYAIHTHQSQRQHLADISAIVRAHGIETKRIDNNDSRALYQLVKSASHSMRTEETKPLFIECFTSRWKEHVGPQEDFYLGYRSEQDVEEWKKSDDVIKLGACLAEVVKSQIEREVEAEIQVAIKFAEDSPFPTKDALFKDVYFEAAAIKSEVNQSESRNLTFIDALQEAFDQAMDLDDSVVVFGLDVDDPKAILGSTRGLPQKYGDKRVFGTPLAEDAMTGVAIGMAIAGLRPVHIHIRMDFLMLAMNQLVNIAAKTRYMFGGQASVPMVVRSIIGRSWGQGAQHSQAFHSYFMHVPGLKVVAPSNPHDAKGCLIAAIKDNDPVIFVEHRLLHSQIGPVPVNAFEVLPGKARVALTGKDITLVGISHMQVECMRAHRYLLGVQISAEVIDPIWLSPLDMETILNSVSKTRRLIIVDNGWTTCGAASEIASNVAQHFEGCADIKIRRMGFEPVPCPTTPSLENHFYPNSLSIASLSYKLTKDINSDWVPEINPDFQDVEFKGPF